ncbi:MAG: glycoside hydrolase family 76 protein [Bacteroidales bacterium]|nr:glycoside hydrolase family 76 protein [Bacteroidales bacterium]MDE7127189.1 glycoside hydrolase family 76 protein [Bacteroidales bacterium]
MKKILFFIICLSVFSTWAVSCERTPAPGENAPVARVDLATQNIERAMAITDAAAAAYISSELGMFKSYNPYTGQVTDTGYENIWEYSSAFEAVTNILYALHLQKEAGDTELYDLHFSRYKSLLDRLYQGMAYYEGTYSLTSYTKNNRTWTVYGVPRASAPGANNVSGILNVYDDQMWIIRDFIEVWYATGDRSYLDKAEYLAEYVIDGFDCHVDEDGNEYGGITWGPGYVSKHSCSNGPFISPLVWLSDIYKGKGEKADRYYIDPSDRKTRKVEQMDKSEYYLSYAIKVYDYQKSHLLRSDGVYDDMMGGDDTGGKVVYETVDGVEYRRHTNLKDRVGPAHSYNSGAILSGAADLYRVTGDNAYLTDIQRLTDASFKYFAKPDETVEGLYTYDFSGNNSWFNAVLLRGYIDAYPAYNGAALPVDSFQQVYDHAYDNFLYEGMMPNSLYLGWANDRTKRTVRGRDQFAYAAQFALLAKYELEN